MTPDKLDGFDPDPDATPHDNVVAMIEAAPDDWSCNDYKAYAFRYIPGVGPTVVTRILKRLDGENAHSLADYM